MNFRHLLAIALFAPLATFADPLPGTQSGVTLTLSFYGTEPIAVNSENEKVVKSSYITRDLLTELLDQGLLGQNETSIRNWKLVVVDRTPLETDENSTLVFYAVKAGSAPVLIPSGRLALGMTDVGVDAEVIKRNGQQQIVTRKNTFRSVVTFSGDVDTDGSAYSFDLNALASGTDSLATKDIKVGSTKFPFTFNLISPISFKPVLGSRTDHLDNNAQTPVEGTIKFDAFKALDITTYPDPQSQS